VTAAATGRAPAGEAGFRLLAEHLPDIILLAFLRGQCRRLTITGMTDPSEGLRL
jgi:hypothetical protein